MVAKIKQTSPLKLKTTAKTPDEVLELAAQEQARAAQRLNELETVAQVSTAIANLRNTDELLRTVCDLTKERFELYHAHIYLLDENAGQLRLGAGAGIAGQSMRASGHHISLRAPRSLVARAARSREGVIVNDVTAEPDYLPNPLLSDTRSELALPLILNDKLLGVLDVQSNETERFDVHDLRVLSILAGQIAAAVENARAFGQITLLLGEQRSQQEQIGQVYRLSQALNEASTELDLVTAIAVNMPSTPSAGVVFLEWDNGDHDMAEGFTVRGFWRAPGNPVVLPNIWSRDTFPNFDRTDPTQLLWSDDMLDDPRISASEAATYTRLNTRARIALPLVRNGKWFGNVTAYWSEVHRHTEAELMWWRTVADQVSLAFSRVVLERQARERARNLETVAEVSAAITSIRNLDELLQQVSDLTKSRFSFYHAHIYLMNVDIEQPRLMLAAGAGEVGQAMLAGGHSIPLDAPRSLVARAARGGTPVLVNDIAAEPGFLPNPLLSQTRSELSVPLILGDRVLGVLDVQSSDSGTFNESNTQVLSTLAAQIAIAIENARAFDQTQALVEYNRTIIRSVPDGLLITDPVTGEIYEANAQMAQMLGYEIEEFHGANFFKLTPPDWIDVTREALSRLGLTGKSLAFEKEYFRKDGSRLPIRLSVAYFIDPVTRQQRAAVIVTDLSVQRDEQRRRELLTQISAGFLNASDDVEILKAFGLMLPDPAAGLSLSYFGEMPDGRSGPYIAAASRLTGVYAPTGVNLDYKSATMMADFLQALPNQPIFIPDVAKMLQNRPDVNLLASQSNLMSGVVIPLRTADQWLGTLIAFWVEPHSFDEAERDLFNSVTPLLISAVAARRAYLAELTAEEELRQLYQLNTAINSAGNEATLLEAVLKYAAPSEITAAQIVLWRFDTQGTLTALETVADRPIDGQRSWIGTVRSIDQYPVLARLDRQAVVWSADVQTDVLFDVETRSLFAEWTVSACVMIPITIEGKSSGTLALYSPRPFTPTNRQLRTFDTVRQQASTVLERLALQHRTAQRVLELETVAQVTTAAVSLLDSNLLLQTVADLTKQQFNLYHAHIYLLDREARFLLMTAGAGQTGQSMKEMGHRIPMSRERSLVAQAARTRRGVVADDVTRELNFMPNPLLPHTRSEVAVPLIIGDQLLGVLDVQSEQIARFAPSDLFVFTTLADQIAVAVQNARLYEEQAHIAEQLREVDQLKSEFLASMSHELRTPLNSIIGFSEILADGLDGELPEEALGDVETIHQSGQHLLELINDVLDLAKIEAGHMELDQRSMALPELVDEVIRTSRILIKDNPVELIAQLPEQLPMLLADEKRLRQILKNLVSNAIKFTKRGRIVISAQPSQDGRQVQINVQDSGVGISAEHQGLVFERFRQVDNSLTRQVGGTGLGLPISRQLIEMHGGKIWLTSTVGHGSTFSFTIPVVLIPETEH